MGLIARSPAHVFDRFLDTLLRSSLPVAVGISKFRHTAVDSPCHLSPEVAFLHRELAIQPSTRHSVLMRIVIATLMLLTFALRGGVPHVDTPHVNTALTSPPTDTPSVTTVSGRGDSITQVADKQPVRGALPTRIVRTHRLPLLNKNGTVSRPADIPEENWKAGHRGVDLEAAPGDVVVASRGGVVVFAGSVAGTPVVSVEHSDGLRTTYEPVLAQVTKGQSVGRGERIGVLANAASLPDAARKSLGLSWGARIAPRSYIDPMTLLGEVRVRLIE